MKDGKDPFKAVKDIKPIRSWCIYGRSGSGKTTFAGTFPGPILLLDVRDHGTESVKEIKDLFVWSIEDFEDIDEVYEYLKRNPNKFRTVVIDTITHLQDLARELVLSKKRKDVNRVNDWGSLTLREHGDVSAMLKSRITDFRDLNLEVVFIAQEKTTGGGDEEEVDPTQMMVPEVGPAAGKAVAAHLNACVSIIGHWFVRLRRFKRTIKGKEVEFEEAVHCLRVGASPIYVTKVRKPKAIEIPSYIENATYNDVIDALEGKE